MGTRTCMRRITQVFQVFLRAPGGGYRTSHFTNPPRLSIWAVSSSIWILLTVTFSLCWIIWYPRTDTQGTSLADFQ